MFKSNFKFLLFALMVVAAGTMFGCGGGGGSGSPSGGTISGVVTNSLTETAIEGATVTTDPDVEGVSITTDASGNYSANLPIGTYTLTFAEENFTSSTVSVTLVAAQTVTEDVALVPTSPVVVSAGANLSGSPGEAFNLTSTIEIMDGSTIQSIQWAQSNSVDVTITGADTLTPTVTLPGENAYKAELLKVLEEPPLSEEQIAAANIELPETGFAGGLQDRFEVVGVDPFALEEAGLVTLTTTVITTTGTYTDTVEIHAELPWKVSTGINNVPIGIPVLLHGKTQASYDWTLTTPTGSTATLDDGTAQNPFFTPDIAGLYQVSVADESASTVEIDIYAGTWVGAISGQDADGKPLAGSCTICHDGDLIPNKFASWNQTGHAEIFTDNLNTSTHYGEGCFACHTVGFDLDVANGGIDEADDYADFLAAGLINNPSSNNWTDTLADFPDTAQMANIQCENCHGPNGRNSDSGVHPQLGGAAERTDISSNVCASCHGEPLRHARFQQWQLSRHANYELAIDEGESGSCSKCHTGNGFLKWLTILLDDDPATDPDDNIDVDWELDETHPQTCATCHDPHSIGTTTGVDTNATVRISGDTPLLAAGFQALDVGKGAICMTCHNARRGLRNDDTWDAIVADEDTGRAPHGPAQTDVIMGQNAFLLVEVGVRGNHSTIEDTCVNCHMEKSPPPALLSYNLGGTNHTFAPSNDICSECHSGGVSATGVQAAFDVSLDQLQGLIEDAILKLITDQIALGRTIDVDGDLDTTTDRITDAADISNIVFTEYHGRQAVTVTLTGGEPDTYRITDIEVVDATEEPQGNLYELADADLPKAGWNWHLVNNDGSRGVHNYAFVNRVLSASINALNDALN